MKRMPEIAAKPAIAKPARNEEAPDPLIFHPYDEFLIYPMNRIVARLNQNLALRLRGRKTPFQHWRVLMVLHVLGPRTLGSLAQFTVIPQSTLSRLIDRMERAQLVARRTDGRDNRNVEVVVTRRGEKTFREIWPAAIAEFHRLAGDISDDELAQFRATLRKMMRNVLSDNEETNGSRQS